MAHTSTRGGYLDEIVAYKRSLQREPLPHLEQLALDAPATRRFLGTMGTYKAAVIGECKRRSPSAGLLREPYEPVELATMYEENGVSAISVLTEDHFFAGSAGDLKNVRVAVELPVLRKDFLLDEQDLLESRAIGSDIVLLIVRILEDSLLKRMVTMADQLGMDSIVEVHDEADLERALKARPECIGINNRDLATFETKLETTERLLEMVPRQVAVISESGIGTGEDVARLRQAGVRGFLVGEAFLRASDPATLVAEMVDAACPDCWRLRTRTGSDGGSGS